MLVTESMPPTSDVLPLIGMYYGITIAIVSLATAMTVLTLNIHHKGIRGREVPNIIKKIFFSVFARLLCIQLETPEKYVENDIVYKNTRIVLLSIDVFIVLYFSCNIRLRVTSTTAPVGPVISS